jgi:hypothetical protein
MSNENKQVMCRVRSITIASVALYGDFRFTSLRFQRPSGPLEPEPSGSLRRRGGLDLDSDWERSHVDFEAGNRR